MKQDALHHFHLAEDKWKNNDIEGSFRELDKAIELDPHNITYYWKRGIQRTYREQYELGVADFTQIIGRTSDHDELIEAYSQRAACYLILGESEKLLADLTWLIENGKTGSEIYEKRGDVKRKLGHFDSALQDYSEALKTLPDDDILLLHQAQTAYHARRYVEAIQYFTEILALNDDKITYRGLLLQYRGSAYYRINKLHEAIDDFNQLQSLNGDRQSRNISDHLHFIIELE